MLIECQWQLIYPCGVLTYHCTFSTHLACGLDLKHCQRRLMLTFAPYFVPLLLGEFSRVILHIGTWLGHTLFGVISVELGMSQWLTYAYLIAGL